MCRSTQRSTVEPPQSGRQLASQYSLNIEKRIFEVTFLTLPLLVAETGGGWREVPLFYQVPLHQFTLRYTYTLWGLRLQFIFAHNGLRIYRTW